ncbi:hypothetical protein H696_00338 [Fonticula alba]|uniref:DNA replication complex GINS protein PSF2 n=1 Tax=Fonticula alba TaxID=691883 RepID=A0A058ZEC7_FONAL|nr:hypothetical protein H696_00338 [Fonticula alba]KCV72760.1 hypothetical protein H696_00338 [Fonticula alba]|eukprot:XP_009492461.1 hypothetical protein H696_00338 [Fonticula alba]
MADTSGGGLAPAPVPSGASLSPPSNSELDFCAENEFVTIVPAVRLPRMNLVTGTIGPLHPQRETLVPLWLALMLKRAGRARIRPPEWLTEDALRLYLKAEIASSAFSPLPFRYLEISQLILQAAPDDVPGATKIRALIEDLRGRRAAKIRRGVASVVSTDVLISLSNMSAIEVNELRPQLLQALHVVNSLEKSSRVADDAG